MVEARLRASTRPIGTKACHRGCRVTTIQYPRSETHGRFELMSLPVLAQVISDRDTYSDRSHQALKRGDWPFGGVRAFVQRATQLLVVETSIKFYQYQEGVEHRKALSYGMSDDSSTITCQGVTVNLARGGRPDPAASSTVLRCPLAFRAASHHPTLFPVNSCTSHISPNLPQSRHPCTTPPHQSLAIGGHLRCVQSPNYRHCPIPIPVLSRHPPLTSTRAAPSQGYPVYPTKRSLLHPTPIPPLAAPALAATARHPANQLALPLLTHLYPSPPNAPNQYCAIFVVKSHASSLTF
ncbi:hypothetical protein JB92DRAFT_3101807 [Gautieria morchelliformis]|nr:hypothetical protein JB92DRAFT_3101807 [Gautieria morchelliformis]